MPKRSSDRVTVVSYGVKRFPTPVKWKKSENKMERKTTGTGQKIE